MYIEQKQPKSRTGRVYKENFWKIQLFEEFLLWAQIKIIILYAFTTCAMFKKWSNEKITEIQFAIYCYAKKFSAQISDTQT